jgi:hypothetical protein
VLWPISEVAARLIEVRSMGHSGPDLLTLSSSHFDPFATSRGAIQTCLCDLKDNHDVR